ncbi:hypothetical protein WMY93_010291 [Mugilogobius chulae]|uniref:Uncharacterized protein n=1 Tax=Mugilogobius chulae TaxID=88201 RepID=A0AAW0PFW5_9GOBI
MWCYQKPGFEGLLLTELQKQQQSNLSVRACSQLCPLSYQPQFSTSLSPVPNQGQKRLLEFGSLGSSTLLHLVRLLYSGEMFGEGEREKQEAVSAAAKLGIHGLVEISHINGEHRKARDGCLYSDVGVQTDLQTFEESQVRLGGWRREVKDGATLLWRERLPTCGTEMATQTDVPHSSGPSSQPPVTYETIDLNTLQTLGETEPLHIPYVPMSVVYPTENDYSYGQSSVSTAIPSHAVQCSSVQNNAYSYPSQAMPCVEETPHWRQDVRAAEEEEWPEEGFEQFEGNIPGFINYFLNPEHKEGSNRTRSRRRQGAGVGGVRQRGARGQPRGRRGRGGLTETVAVQDVGVSKLSKMYLHRWGMYGKRTGQGGGAIGRKLYLKSRELVRSGKNTQGRKGRGTEWNLTQCMSILVKTEAGTKRPRGRSRKIVDAPPQVLVSPSSKTQRVTKQPPPRGADEQHEKIDQLLEEVMMGLDILPNNNRKSQANSATRHSGAPDAAKTQRKQSVPPAVASAGGEVPSSDVPVLQQQTNEGELTVILDQFLQSFEQIEPSATQSSSESSESHTNVNKYKKHHIQLSLHKPQGTARTPGRAGTSTQSETSGTDSPMRPSQKSANSQQGKSSRKSSPAVRRPARRKNDYLFSLEKPRTKKKNTARDALKKERVKQQVTKQLQQFPVVKLERRGALPENIKVQELSQSPGPKTKKSFSTTPLWSTKTYPIRSRFKEAQITDAIPFLEEPLSTCRSHATKHGLPFSFPQDTSLSTVEEQMESNHDESGSDTREPDGRRRKRALDSDVELSCTVEVKRNCLDSEKSPHQSTEVVDIIDVETVSLNSTSNTVFINSTEEEIDLITEECATEVERESNDIIDVDSLDGDFDETALKGDDLVHAEVICSLRADIATAGEPEDLDIDIDVIGGSSPAPDPVFISWTDSDETDNDTDVDAPDEQTVVLSKGQLVRC